MDDAFKIFIEQLRDGHREEISEEFSPAFLDVNEKDLAFKDPVIVKGEAYLAENELIMHLDISTKAQMPCVICNEPATADIYLEDFYHAEPASDIKSGVYNFMPVLREAILLETPQFAEHQGNCPTRKEIDRYLKKTQTDNQSPSEDGYKPFANLDWDLNRSNDERS